MREKFTVNVRALAEFACASGSITANAIMAARLKEGRDGHVLVQSQLPEGWESEVAVSLTVPFPELDLEVIGRADAIMIEGSCLYLMDIKTTRSNPYDILSEDYPVHWAQAEIYAYMFCKNRGLRETVVFLTYAGVHGGEHRFQREYEFTDLEERFSGYVQPYAQYMKTQYLWKMDSTGTMKELKFPFDNFRDGQREMAAAVYRAMKNHSRVLIEAPTGIGKTAASLFGALKALGEGSITSIFYLTARTTGRRSAENALAIMRSKGLKVRSVTITAKEKVCYMDKPECLGCRYADGYYDRVGDALREGMHQEVLDFEKIDAIAQAYGICPFELSLDLTTIADVVICDYNYVYDPRIRLKRHFERKSGAGILVDEAHNLADRTREMYSARLSGLKVQTLMDRIRELSGEKNPMLDPIRALRETLRIEDAEYDVQSMPPENVVNAAYAFVQLAEKTRVSEDNTVELFMDCLWFVRVAKNFDDANYRVLIRPENEDNSVEVVLWCFAANEQIDRMMKRTGGTAMFSATLAPMDYYGRLLSITDRDSQLKLESPFPPENLFVARLPVSVKFSDREKNLEAVCRVIHAMTSAKTGNYIACFPSHAYLTQACRYYRMRYPDEVVIRQENGMGEKEREAFIARFEAAPKVSMVAFIVLGGVFAEGVDLPDDRLSGAAIISTGMALPNQESEVLAEIYSDGFEDGVDAAYTYPGFRRVLQAAGRVIRTETDRGVVLLVDERYASEKYTELIPAHWRVRKIRSMSTLNADLQAFWKKNQEVRKK